MRRGACPKRSSEGSPASFLAVALRIAPAGIHVASPERVWQAAQQDTVQVARNWLG